MRPVTVLMPVYNGLPYLREAVDSILRQSFRDFGFLIIDDGSTDCSGDYLDQLADPRIEVVHERHRGLGAALNQGLDICGTEFLARMDADDVALPGRLEAQLAFLRRHEEIGILGTQIAHLGVAGGTGFSSPMPCDHKAIYADLLRGRLALSHPSIMCRTSVLKRIGGYRIQGVGEDWEMFLRIGEVSRIANLGEVLHLYRVHLGSVNARHTGLVRARIAYACYCARQRAGGLPEITFDEFAAQRPFWRRLVDRMDCYGLTQYQRALHEILSASQFKGYARLGWSALCSPQLTWQRLCREARKIRRTTGPKRHVAGAPPDGTTPSS
jgi:glycosyltransferase involved in cell wall biosynthesis